VPGVTKWILVAALAGGAVTAAACATTGHTGPDEGEGPGATVTDTDAGVAHASAPAPLNISLVTDTTLCAPGAPSAAWSPVRRVSRVEYDNMVRDLLGDTTAPATSFAPESPLTDGVNFQSNTYTGVSALIVQQYMQTAESLAASVVADTNRLNNTVLPCHTQDDACAQQFISTWANKAFRGQLDMTTSASLFQLYSAVKAQFDFPTGIQAVITAALESPRFLYVLEFGQGDAQGSAVPLSSYEIAARLALFLWRSVPDDTLMQAAAAGQLATTDQVAAQATRMLAKPASGPWKALDAMNDFTTQWMQLQATPTLGKDTQYTDWSNPKIGAELQDEALTDMSQAVLADNEGLDDILTSSSSYIDPDLATFYKVSVGSGAQVTVNDAFLAQGQTTFTKTDLTAASRSGILTSAGVLATQSHTTLPSTVLRGKLVREQILCDEIPPPPPNVPPPPAGRPDGGTTRSLFEAHETTPGCVTCHQYMDPIGFGFGHFDATGAYQAFDQNGFDAGPALDVTGQINAMTKGDLSGIFDGAKDLVTQLAGASQVSACFAVQELRYALSRVETKADACSAQQAYAAFTGGKLNVQALMLALVQSDSFRYRSVINAGAACQ
jgi:hypothetical protein